MDLEFKKKLVFLIKEKKELNNLDYEFVEEKLDKELLNNKKIRKKLDELTDLKQLKRSKEIKKFISEIRQILRQIYGVFDLDVKCKKQELLVKIAENYSDNLYFDNLLRELLSLHKSTIERIPYYQELYEQIASENKKARIILDLGCGFNPYTANILENKLGHKVEYYASDISSKDMQDINNYFKKTNIKGEAKAIDLVNHYDLLEEFPSKKVDLVMMFKLLDSLESVKKNTTHKVIDLLLKKAKSFVISFPTQSIGGKKKIPPEKRAWFENMLKHKGLVYKTFEISNEIFYTFKNH